MAKWYEALATVTVGSGGSANIEFTSIPQTYTDLKIVLSARVTNNDSLHYGPAYITLNGNTSAIYDNTRLMGYATTVLSAQDQNQTSLAIAVNGSSSTTTSFSINNYYFTNYTSSNNKSISNEYAIETNSTTNNLMAIVAMLANTTSAISSIKIAAASGQTFVEYTTATIYGIR